MAANAVGKHVFKPKALLVRNVKETDDWVDTTFHTISKVLRENHIAVTTDLNEIQTVHMTIVFLNATFVTNYQHLLQLFKENVIARKMFVNLVVYENNNDPDSKLVTDFFKKFDGTYPRDFDFNGYDPETLTKLVLMFLNKTRSMFCKIPYSNMNKNRILGGTLESFIDPLVTYLNPLHLYFTKIQPDLISEVVAMSHNIENERKLRISSCEPLLALFKYQPCPDHDCTSQLMTTILQLLYTHNNILNHKEFSNGCLYVSMPLVIENGEPPPSFATAFHSAREARYLNSSSWRFLSPPFLVVIDDLQKFVPEGEDPKYVLSRIVEQLGGGSLVITSIPNSLKLDTKCLGPVRGASQCIHSPPNTIGQPWPLCYTILSSKLHKLAMEDIVKDEDDSQKTDQSCYLLSKLIRKLTQFDVPVHTYPHRVFSQVLYPNPFLYTSLIRGYALQFRLMESIELYNAMRKHGISPVSFTFTAVLKASGDVVELNLGKQIHGQVILIGGFMSDLYVGNALIDMYVKCDDLECGRLVFDEMGVRDVISWTSLIVAYTKSCDMFNACKLFDDLPHKDLVAWTAIITGFAQNAKPREALEYFEKMQALGVKPDEVTLVGAISACAQLGAANYAHCVGEIAVRVGFRSTENVVIGSALIDMYSKCGNVDKAYNLFLGMKERNVYSYSSMIVGYAIHGRAHEALQLYNQMLETEIQPNRVTFIGILTACSHGGMVEQGRRLFAEMENSYGVEKSADHYAVMVDILGRAGCLEEALELIKTMPIKPNGGVWGALLGACRIHGNPDIAEIAGNHLFEIEPDSVGNYLLLSNIYASAGRWADVLKVRKLMRKKGLNKIPGSSWVEAKKGVIHEFFAGDTAHAKSKEIKQALDDLLVRLSFDGYKPNLTCVPYDISDEDKKRILMGHSEKLALAYGLISTSDGSAIRIVKNLRICEDCHSVMRFHHFHNGVCSCNNFW